MDDDLEYDTPRRRRRDLAKQFEPKHQSRRRLDGESGRIVILPPEEHGDVWNGSAR